MGSGRQVPPCSRHVVIYFAQYGRPEQEALAFWQYYEKKGWKSSRGHRLTNWKEYAWRWIWKNIEKV